MVIKRFTGKNLNEAMAKMKFELGSEAIVISQRKIRQSGFKGLFSGKLIEVTATVENLNNSNATARQQIEISEDEEFKKSIESIKEIMEKEILSKKPKQSTENELSKIQSMINEHNANAKKEKDEEVLKEKSSSVSVEDIHNEVSELKDLINKVVLNTSESKESETEAVKENNSELKQRLNDIDIDERYHDEIIKSISDYSKEDIDETEILRDIFERDIIVTNADLKGRVVLVGPTGVGKTTTIAKLAGRLALIEKKKVGLITIDTYRIGAVEQLKTYAEIMNIPFKVVITIKEMQESIEEMSDCDVVLIDTTGRSSKNTMQISELRAFVQNAKPNSINMVISATTKNKDIISILKGYSELEYNNIIITKLDETTAYGSIYNISRIANKPINYITVGQNVPDDIKRSTKEELSRFILGEESLC